MINDLFYGITTTEAITLLGISFTIVIGFLNILISSHKNRMSGITQNRTQWIQDVREITNKITSWEFVLNDDDFIRELANLRSNVNSLMLHLNISNKIDNEIVDNCLAMYDYGYKLSFYKNLLPQEAQETYEVFYSHRAKVRLLMRIYLKKEWTRVKAESNTWRVPFKNYWIPFYGFHEKWATSSLLKKYESIQSYDFKPWIYTVLSDSTVSKPDSILVENENGETVLKVPSGKLA